MKRFTSVLAAIVLVAVLVGAADEKKPAAKAAKTKAKAKNPR